VMLGSMVLTWMRRNLRVMAIFAFECVCGVPWLPCVRVAAIQTWISHFSTRPFHLLVIFNLLETCQNFFVHFFSFVTPPVEDVVLIRKRRMGDRWATWETIWHMFQCFFFAQVFSRCSWFPETSPRRKGEIKQAASV
jgi:hypothetical protein